MTYMLKNLEGLMDRYNAVNATPANEDSDFTQLYGLNIDCASGILETHYMERVNGNTSKGKLRFATYTDFNNWVDYHT